MFFNTSLQDLKEQRREKRIGRKSERLANAKRTKISKRINLRSIARYSMMPEIIPRVRSLGMHFGHFAYLIALVLNSARLIPNGHPALHARSIGQFSVRNVLAIAANNIEWKWKNVDQIAIFSSVVIGMILILVQAVLIALYAFSGTAFAQGAAVGSVSFFETPAENVQTDVVLIFLDQVFGANLDMFGAAAQPTGTPVYEGLQAILGLYSMATMVIAVIIVLYYILTVVGEAAKTGTPFGQRFNSLWAPIRLVVALGLLVPLSSGLNSAQYLTLWTAKMGSGLATQVWTEFASHMTETTNIISNPPPSKNLETLVLRIFLNEVCSAVYNQTERNNGRQITILQNLNGTSQAANFGSPAAMIEASKQIGWRDVDISWSQNTAGDRANDYSCGQILVSLAEFDFYARTNENELVDQNENPFSYALGWITGGRAIQDKIGTIHKNLRNKYIQQIGKIAETVRPAAIAIAEFSTSVDNHSGKLGNREALDATNIPQILNTAASALNSDINTIVVTSYEELTDSQFAKSDAFDEMIKRGWGAAGIWYGNISKINQAYLKAINAAAPTMGKLFSAPELHEAGMEKNNGWPFGLFRMGSSNPEELASAILFASTEYGEFIEGGIPQNSPQYQDATYESAHAEGEDGLARAIMWLVGGDQLFILKENPTLDPMARISAAGHAIIGNSMFAFVLGSAGFVVDAVSSIMLFIPGLQAPGLIGKFIAGAAGVLSTLFFTLAGIGLIAGVFLAFIIPFLPFVYFSFAVIGWILEIFEAIVAMPLWALAHLRIDGEGMPGQAAIGGYQLLLMILLRPALIVFGLIGGYIIFGAAMYFFSTLYASATAITMQEVSGNSINAIGVFVYTLIFTFLTYNIALMCFKMIDDVPKGMLRWLGASVQPFSDSKGDPISGAREVIIGGVAATAGLGNAMKGVPAAKKDFASKMSESPKNGGDPKMQQGKQILSGIIKGGK